MVVKQEIRKSLNIGSKEAYRNLLSGIRKEKWSIIYKEEEDFEVFGLTSAFGGFTTLSLATERARYVPFFARIFPQAEKCKVLVIAAGSEYQFGQDFGRNKKVAEKILGMCLGR